MRVCSDGYFAKRRASLLSQKYRVTRIRKNGHINVRSEFGSITATNVSSWVLCADMKEHA